ncbi:hypothetical protein QVD17_19714 [Tagetes erecta]|uniref:Uncharacterized protein n=1 Tax=Tagetes erecta TaxID=13708 RepID=A0AAD8KJY4_TARER|nr:hypothetical protein QVD17_19714 [Tagetes erecta]
MDFDDSSFILGKVPKLVKRREGKRVLRQQFFLVSTKSVFPYSFLALSLVQIGHVLTRSFFKIFEPLKDAVGILLTGRGLAAPSQIKVLYWGSRQP